MKMPKDMLSKHYKIDADRLQKNSGTSRTSDRACFGIVHSIAQHATLKLCATVTKIDADEWLELIGCSEDEMMGNTMNHIGQKGVGILMRDFARHPDRKLSKAFKTFDFDECTASTKLC